MTAILGWPSSGRRRAECRAAPLYRVLCNNGHALLDLINSILDLAKIESGRLTLEHISFDLRDVVEKSAQTLAIRAHVKRLELIVSIAPDVPNALLGDPLRLRQVLLNLIGNAIKFTENGEVLISVERESSPSDSLHLKFSVRDTGIGIAKDKIPVLFAAFEQADTSTARKYGGSGSSRDRQAHCRSHAGRGYAGERARQGKRLQLHFAIRTGAQPAGASDGRISALPSADRRSQPGRARGGAPDAKRSRRNSYGRRVLRGRHHAIERARTAGQPPRLVLLGDRIASQTPQAMEQLITEASQCEASIIAMIYCDNLTADLARLNL